MIRYHIQIGQNSPEVFISVHVLSSFVFPATTHFLKIQSFYINFQIIRARRTNRNHGQVVPAEPVMVCFIEISVFKLNFDQKLHI